MRDREDGEVQVEWCRGCGWGHWWRSFLGSVYGLVVDYSHLRELILSRRFCGGPQQALWVSSEVSGMNLDL